MARHLWPLLIGVLIQLQYQGGLTQLLEPYQSQSPLSSTSFINSPLSSVNPYSKFTTSVDRPFPAVDQNSFIQPYSSGVSQISYPVQDNIFSGQQQSQPQQLQQQQIYGGGQSSFLRQQQPSVSYFTITPEQARSLTASQQFSQPNFIYSSRAQQGQLPQTIDASSASSSLPVQREFVYPLDVPQQSLRRSSQVQFPTSFIPRTQQSASSVSNEKFVPLTSLRSSLPEDSKVITLGDSPFVITAIKPKSPPSLQVIPSARNPLESIRSEDIIEAFLNKGKGDGVRNQIVVTTASDNGRIPVTEPTAFVFSTTPMPEIITTAAPTTMAPVTPTEKIILTSTTPVPTTTTTTTTTQPPPPPVHDEITTIEERHFVSRKKKVSVFIRVEDAAYDAEERENYATKQDFHEWTKTIVEPTDIFDEKTSFSKNETHEVDGPYVGVDVTKVVCRTFIDQKESVVELDLLKEPRATCPGPLLTEGGSWEERAFRRIESEVEKKLKDIFNFPKGSFRPNSEGSFVSIMNTPTAVRTTEPLPLSAGFLRQSIEAIQNLAPKIHEKTSATSKRGTNTPRHLEDTDLLADASEVKLSPDTFYLTSKRETKPEVVEEVKKKEVKTEVLKTEKVKTEEKKTEEVKTEKRNIQVTPSTPDSHIMVITKTPPVRPPNPYHHPTTTLTPDTEVLPTKTETIPVAQALSSSVENHPTHPEENKDKTFFRPST